MKLLKENKNTMTLLQKSKTKPMYDAPDSYFDELQNNILQRVLQEKQQPNKKFTWLKIVGIAATFSIILTLSYFFIIKPNAEEHFYVQDANEAVDTAVDYYISDIEMENFYETMNDLDCYFEY